MENNVVFVKVFWVKVFKNGPSKICGRQPLKNFTLSILEYLNPFEAYYGFLSFFQEDVQTSVRSRFHDPSTNVREAAVDLIGQFILKCPKLIKQYYDMIIDRILDTGISVRKRVIKILRDICLEHPDFEKIPEICLKMIRRVDDEIGIKVSFKFDCCRRIHSKRIFKKSQ